MRWKELLAVLVAVAATAIIAGAAVAGGEAVPGPKERCPVCGMSVAGYPNWIATAVFQDGSQVFFDGPKDLFNYFFDLSAYGRRAEEIADLFVTEYYTTERLPAREVFFVAGSDVLGPMGQELVPVKGREAAESFFLDHRGDRILSFDGVDFTEVPALK
jgi:nitrous oxide reductase accessory protein NosL